MTNLNVVQKQKDDIPPRPVTPPRSTRLKDPPSVLLSRSRLIEATAPLATFNPFSPQKKRKGKEKELSPDIGDPRNLFEKSGSGSVSRSLSPNPFPPIQASSSTQSSQVPVSPPPNSAVLRARKRLRGEYVSPSPNKEKRRRVISQNGDLFPRINLNTRDSDQNMEESDPDSSFVDNSPVKAPVGGKTFPKLFTESCLPSTDLFAMTSKPQVGRLNKRLFLQSNQQAIYTPRMQNARKRTRSGSSEFNSAQRDPIGEASSEASSENSINQLTNADPISDTDARDDLPLPQRSKSPLIPPSPPLSAAVTATFNRPPRHPTTTLTISKGRKKAKFHEQSASDTDGPELSTKLKVVNRHDTRLKQMQNPDEADGWDWDLDPISSRTRFDEPLAASPDPAVEVNLPDELRQMLALESIAPQAGRLNEDKLVKDLLYGKRTNHYYPNKGGEIWDVGEDHLEGGGTQNAGEEEDWEGEPISWEIAEL